MALLLALFLVQPCHGAETAAFLKLDAGARALAMAGAQTAALEGGYGAACNPAGLAMLNGKEAAFTHAGLAAGARQELLTYGQALGPRAWPGQQETLRTGPEQERGSGRTRLFAGASLAYVSQPALDGRDEAGRPSGNFGASDMALGLAGAVRLAGWSWGGALRLIRSELAEASAIGAAADLGFLKDIGLAGPGRLMLGASARNLGPGLKLGAQTDDLPLILAGGLAYRLQPGLLLAADVRHRPRAEKVEAVLGAETAVLPFFSLRAGYGRPASSGRAGSAGLGAFTAGFGLKTGRYRLDYAVAPFGELGAFQRISVGTALR